VIEKNVLDHGFAKLVDHMGSDLRVCEAARVSTGALADKGSEKNQKLIEYLYLHKHLSPFEQVVLTFHIKCPIFVARQWFRHRTMSANEKSSRFQEFEWECFYPDKWRIQDKKNKQVSSGELEPLISKWSDNLLEDCYQDSQNTYNEFLTSGVAREQARIIMPVGQYTEFFMTVNLRNLFHFLELRLHPHAQEEIRVYAEAILSILKDMDNIKFSVSVFQKMLLLDYKLSDLIESYDVKEIIKHLDELK
jgi:thymidylate synthase (FAD)